MTVELIPKCDHAFFMGVANATFYEMVNSTAMVDVIGVQNTNDPIDVSNDDAMECKKILSEWFPPEEWGGGFRSETMKSHFMEFFGRCGGFTTR